MKNYSAHLKKISPILIVILLIIIVGGVFFIKGKTSPPQNVKECISDSDCVCGVDKVTRACAIGNLQSIDTAEQCPDFCYGIEGTLTIKCISNKCNQTTQNDNF